MHTPLHTPICDKLGIEYPIFLAGMGGVSLSKLVAAVSNAGGLGVLGGDTGSQGRVGSGREPGSD